MKTNHYIQSAFIAIIAMMTVKGLQAQNLLINGDFEATEAPFAWNKNNVDILLSEKTEYGINSQTCRMPGLGAARWIWQNVNITVSGKYLFEFAGRIQNAALFGSGGSDNNHATLGPATFKGEILGFDTDGTTLLPDALLVIESQSNTNITIKGEVEIPESITKAQVKISKNWNVPYIDDVLFYLEGTLGVANNRIENLKVYSNEGTLTVTSSSQLNEISIYDTTGRMMRTIKSENKTTHQILLGSLSSGLYVITATDIDGKTGTVKHLIK